MLSSLTAVWNRVYAIIGRVSMYRLVLLLLGALAAIALVLSLFQAIAYGPLELIAAAIVLAAAAAATDAVAHRILGKAWRLESSLITALILLFVLRPTLEPLELAGLAIAAVVASASKYLLVWQGRHIFNPAAVGAAVLTIVSIWLPELGASAWWVGTPALAAPVIVAGLIVLLRTEKVRVFGLFVVIALAVSFATTAFAYVDAGVSFDVGTIVSQLVWSSPYLFLGAFMLSEPLTLPPRRWQQYVIAAVVGVLAGWPGLFVVFRVSPEHALLIGNLVAFLFCFRPAVRLEFVERTVLTPTVRELTFRAGRGVRFAPGQYLELEVPHAHADARGTRREFSIVSAPEELPLVKIALREGSQSSYKKALAQVEAGRMLPVTGIWGDFVLPAKPSTPVLMVAAGIGVTPFVSQLRHLRHAAQQRDVVFVYVAGGAEELAFRDDLEASGVPVIVVTKTEPSSLPAHWRWAGGGRLTADSLVELVPDIAQRHAYISGPPGLIADLAPALEKAHAITTDAFSGY